MKYGNSTRVVDGLYAAIDGGFAHSALRRVVLLVTAGIEGPSRAQEREPLELARRDGVSVYPIHASEGRSGGAVFNLRDLGKNAANPPAGRVFGGGNLPLREDVKVEVRQPAKAYVSAQAE